MSTLGQHVRRLGAELVIVVFGVLIALWADGLATDRDARRSLLVHLVAVRAELNQVAGGLDDHIRLMERQLERLDWLAAFGAGSEEGEADDLFEGVAQGLLSPVTFEPQLGALGSLEASGLMPSVRTASLPATLSGLRDALRFLGTAETVNITGPAQRLFDPWVLEAMPFMWSEMARYDGRTRGPADPLRDADWSPLRSPRGQALLAMKYDLIASTLSDWRQFAVHLDRAIQLIDEELGPA